LKTEFLYHLKGDSGGPFVCKNKELSGVVSFGIGCATADVFGIYTSLGNIFDDFLTQGGWWFLNRHI
jgi:secreted trypsin-like serine protease